MNNKNPCFSLATFLSLTHCSWTWQCQGWCEWVRLSGWQVYPCIWWTPFIAQTVDLLQIWACLVLLELIPPELERESEKRPCEMWSLWKGKEVKSDSAYLLWMQRETCMLSKLFRWWNTRRQVKASGSQEKETILHIFVCEYGNLYIICKLFLSEGSKFNLKAKAEKSGSDRVIAINSRLRASVNSRKRSHIHL